MTHIPYVHLLYFLKKLIFVDSEDSWTWVRWCLRAKHHSKHHVLHYLSKWLSTLPYSWWHKELYKSSAKYPKTVFSWSRKRFHENYWNLSTMRIRMGNYSGFTKNRGNRTYWWSMAIQLAWSMPHTYTCLPNMIYLSFFITVSTNTGYWIVAEFIILGESIQNALLRNPRWTPSTTQQITV